MKVAYERETKGIHAFFDKINQQELKSEKGVYIFSLAENGCHSCIIDVLQYAKLLKEYPSIQFIVSDQGEKTIKMILLEYGVDKERIVVDGKNIAQSMNLIPDTAIAYFISEGVVTNVHEINSANVDEVFEKVLRYLDTNHITTL